MDQTKSSTEVTPPGQPASDPVAMLMLRIAELQAEREQLRAKINAQLQRDAEELNARAAAALAPHNRAIQELQQLLAAFEGEKANEAAGDA